MTERVICLGVAGLGRAFSLMLPTFLKDARLRLSAACDPRAEARDQFARDFGRPTYETVEALAEDRAVDAIYIATPHQLHARHVQIAAAAGKHVLVEKPMALSLEDCDAMIDACRGAGVHLIVGHCHSFDFPYLQSRKIIRSGEFGAVRMIQALNYTDFLYRPRRAEELSTAAGGGVVFSQAAHQIDVVRLLAGSRATSVRAALGAWDAARPTEGAYSALLWFDNGAFASLSYSGYGHFDSDEWCEWVGELGMPKNAQEYGSVRRRLGATRSASEESRLKAEGTYGGARYQGPSEVGPSQAHHQHFGPTIICCERGDLRPMPDAIWVYGNDRRERRALQPPQIPRQEVVDELYAAVVNGERPLHDGAWAKSTLEIVRVFLQSADERREISLCHQVG